MNYRGFRAASIDLDRPLTVLVGLNGSGKSSVLTAIATTCSKVLRESHPDRVALGWKFEDVDVRVGESQLTVTAEIENGDQTQSVRAEHIRGKESPAALRTWPVLRAAPFLPVFYIATRSVAHGNDAFRQTSHSDALGDRDALSDAMNPGESAGPGASGLERVAFGSMFRWFKDREDIENESRVAKQDLKLEDPQLAAVRAAVNGMLPGFSGLRVQRDPLHMIVRKNDETLAIDQLSDGEKLLLAMTADLARRLAIHYASRTEPLRGEALVLIDEIELHLHARWQRTALVNLRKTFPGCQFIVTTHSPQVLSTVPGDAVLLLDQFQVVRPGVETNGRDSNSILREVLGVEERPLEEIERLRKVDDALDRGDLDDARKGLVELERRLGWQDVEVVRLKTRLEFLEAPLDG